MHCKYLSAVLLALFLAVALFAAVNVELVRADMLIVPDNYPTIQNAINSAASGDTILVRAGNYDEHVVVNRTVSLVGEDRQHTFLNWSGEAPAGGLIVESDSVSISNFTCSGFAHNVVVNATTNVTIVRNTILFTSVGMYADHATNLTVVDNLLNGTGGLDNIGILMDHAFNCWIMNNTITDAIYDGIRLWYADTILIQDNFIKENDFGIYSLFSNNNMIIHNDIRDNGHGITFDGDDHDNTIFANNFVDNFSHATLSGGAPNTWDNGTAGNYWSDYLTKYPNATQMGGVWSEPYVIAPNNVDRYPLVNPVVIPELNPVFIYLTLIIATIVAALSIVRSRRT